jgi:hypothetical protein
LDFESIAQLYGRGIDVNTVKAKASVILRYVHQLRAAQGNSEIQATATTLEKAAGSAVTEKAGEAHPLSTDHNARKRKFER